MISSTWRLEHRRRSAEHHLRRPHRVGDDQRVELVLPLADGAVALTRATCERAGLDWCGAWLALPPQRRNPLRTHTIRAARPAAHEVDVVLHAPAAGRAVTAVGPVLLEVPPAADAAPLRLARGGGGHGDRVRRAWSSTSGGSRAR